MTSRIKEIEKNHQEDTQEFCDTPDHYKLKPSWIDKLAFIDKFDEEDLGVMYWYGGY